MTTASLSTPITSGASFASLGPGRKILLLLFNAVPLIQVVGLCIIVWRLSATPWWCAAALAGWLYLVPPLVCRIVLWLVPIRRQIIPLGSREFFAWWLTLNLQVLYLRFPFLEELVRIVPSCYSMWLRLWGARIGKLTYWGAELRILDRPFLRIGDHVTFGSGVRLNPHVIMPDADGRMVLVLAPVTIGDRVSVGGYSLMVAGTEIAADQCTRAFLILPPFNRLEGGRRHKPADAALVLADEGATDSDR